MNARSGITAAASASGETRATGGTARETSHRDSADEFTPAAIMDAADDIGGLLAQISDDARRHAGAVAASIKAEFATRMKDAKQRAPRHELPAIMQALAAARASALAAAAQKAAAEVQGRQRAVREASADRKQAAARAMRRSRHM